LKAYRRTVHTTHLAHGTRDVRDLRFLAVELLLQVLDLVQQVRAAHGHLLRYLDADLGLAGELLGRQQVVLLA